MKKTILLMASLVAVGGYAQNTSILEGVITNKAGEPLGGAHISAKNSSVVSDELGRYKLILEPGNQSVTINADKYETEIFTINADGGIIYKDIQLAWSTTVTIPEIVMNRERKLQVNKLNIKNLEAPMSVSVLNSEQLRQMDVQNMDDAAKNFVGINPINQYGAFQFFNVRGFENFVLLYDGLRDERHNITQSAPITNLANVERIEVLKGPSGELFGHSALGGIINIIRKKPTEKFTGNASAAIGSFNTYNFVFGVGGSLSKNLRYRFDAGSNKTDGWREVKESTNNASITLQYLWSPKTQIELLLQYNKDHYAADAGVPTNNEGKILEGLSEKMNFNISDDFVTNEKKEIQLSFKHHFNTNTKFSNTLSYYDDNINYLADEVIFYSPSAKTYSRYNGPYHFNHFTKPWSNQMTLNFKFNTSGLQHSAIVGNVVSYLDRKTLYGDVTDTGGLIDIPIQNQRNNYSVRALEIARIFEMNELLIGTYFHDWIEFSDYFKVLAGVRYDHFNGSYFKRRNLTDPKENTKDQFNNISYRLGVSVQPVKDVLNLYASASNFFKPTRSHDHRLGKKFLPERGFQAEAGLKLEKKNVYNISLAGFYIRKNNMIVGHSILEQVGGAESRGVEVEAELNPTEGLYLKAGYAYTDTQFISKGNDDSKIVGNTLPWVPKNSFNSWVNYELPASLKGLGVGLGLYYKDKTYQNQYNDQSLPSYTLLNGVVYYKTKNNVKLALNVENLMDKVYIKSALSKNDLYSNDPANEIYQSQMQAYPGRGRNFKFTISYEF